MSCLWTAAASVPGLPGVVVQALALASNPPPYSPHRSAPRPGDNIGVLLHNPASGARVFYAPGLGRVTPDLLELMATCSAVLVDGTFWSGDEMQRLGLGTRSAADMGHLPQSGAGGMLEQLARLPSGVRGQDWHAGDLGQGEKDRRHTHVGWHRGHRGGWALAGHGQQRAQRGHLAKTQGDPSSQGHSQTSVPPRCANQAVFAFLPFCGTAQKDALGS